MLKHFLTFEKNIADLEGKIEDLKHISSNSDLNIAEEIGRLQKKVSQELTNTYSKLSPWQKVLVARHPDRPQFQDVIDHMIEDYVPLGGDRLYGNDNALTGGLGYFGEHKVLLLGIDKGKNTSDRVLKNFGMARPEGYRKAIRLMELADKFQLPILTFVDTAGAYPGKGAEERGQAQAIASCIDTSLKIQTPMISTILGEGGSGGAVALTTGNVLLMFEHSIYSVISPEGCASILWRDASKALEAAKALKLTAQDMKNFKIVDDIIPEPLGGSHRDYKKSLDELEKIIKVKLQDLLKLEPKELKLKKQNKFLKLT